MSGPEGKPFDIPRRLVWQAWKQVKANKGAAGVDGQSIEAFEAGLKNNLYKVWNRIVAVLRQGRGQGRHRAPVPGRLPRQRRGAVRRPRPGEGVSVPHPEAPQPGDREGVPVADPRHAPGQLLLLLLRG
jgi:hypothetical protein